MALQVKLKHGNIYTLTRGRGDKSITFLKNEWTTVSEDDYVYLKENAKERVLVKQGGVTKTQFIAKFEFREGVESTETGDKPRRQRQRKAAAA